MSHVHVHVLSINNRHNTYSTGIAVLLYYTLWIIGSVLFEHHTSNVKYTQLWFVGVL